LARSRKHEIADQPIANLIFEYHEESITVLFFVKIADYGQKLIAHSLMSDLY